MKILPRSIVILFCALIVVGCGKKSVNESMNTADLKAVCDKLSSSSKQYEIVRGIHRRSGAGSAEIDGVKLFISIITLRDKREKSVTVSFKVDQLSDYDYENLDGIKKYDVYQERLQSVIYDYRGKPGYKNRIYGVCGYVHQDDRGEKILYQGEIGTLTYLNDAG